MPETLFLHDTDRRDTFHCFLGQSWEQSEEGRLQAHAMLMADTIVYHCEASVSGVALLVLFLFSLTVIFVLLPLLIYGEWGRWVSVPLLMMAIVPLPFIPFLYRHFVGRSSLCDCSRTPVQLKNAGEGKIEFQDLLTHDEKPNDHCTCAIILEDPHPAESPVSGVCILDVLPIELLMFILRLVPYTYCGCLMLVCRQFAAAASNDSVFRFWCNEHFQCGHRGRYPSEYVLSWKEHFVSVVQSSRLVRSLSARGISSGSHLALNTRMKSAIQRVVGQSSSGIINLFCPFTICVLTDTHEITADGVIATVKALIDHGFDVNVANSSGITALHEACDRGLTAVAELLLDSGAVSFHCCIRSPVPGGMYIHYMFRFVCVVDAFVPCHVVSCDVLFNNCSFGHSGSECRKFGRIYRTTFCSMAWSARTDQAADRARCLYSREDESRLDSSSPCVRYGTAHCAWPI